MVENSVSSAQNDKKNTSRTSSLTLADRLEILGDLLIAIQEDGQPVTIKKFSKNGVNGVVIVLPNINIIDGVLVSINE